MELNTYQKGQVAEQLVLEHFLKQGLELVARNFRSKAGEIDLVLRERAGTIVFIEVRSSVKLSGWLRHSIGPAKQRRLRLGFQWFFWKNSRLKNAPYRFDVVWVESGKIIEHWKNVAL